MPRNQKPEFYQLRKATGVPLSRTFVNYTLDQLKLELTELGVPLPEQQAPVQKQPLPEPELPDLIFPDEPDPDPVIRQQQEQQVVTPKPVQYPVSNTPDPEEMPGQRLNQQLPDDVIRVDDQGRLWYQEEVRKPAYPKPRGRRVLKYLEPGVEKATVQNGEYIETFEVAGQGPGKPAEVKITLPSYQVGIYKDPRFPFRIHCYNGTEGFNMYEVHEFYGGAELVPETCKRIYVENDLCYDVRTVIRAIQTEHRQLQLLGKV